MLSPLLRSFDRFEDAVAAREALLAAGVAPAAVQVQPMEDEAGPAQGNFLVGNGRLRDDSTPNPSAASQLPYEPNFAHPVFRATNLLLLQPADDAQRAQAAAILDRFGGVGPAEGFGSSR